MIDSNKSSGRRVDRSRLEIGSKKNGRKIIIIILLLTALSSGMGNDHDDGDEIVKKVPIKMLWRETQLRRIYSLVSFLILI